jgi:urea transporter
MFGSFRSLLSVPPPPASEHPIAMNVALWIAQGLVAFAMLAAGGLKVVTPRVKLAEKLKWAATWSDANVKLLGLAEVLGAVGLIVPWLTWIAPVLTPVAAVALTIIMVGAAKTHLDHKEPLVAPAVLGALCVFIALGRFGVL